MRLLHSLIFYMGSVKFSFIVIFLMLICLSSQGSLATNKTSFTPSSQNVAVYGLDSADYLTSVETVKTTQQSKKKYSRRRAFFQLPDSFYFIGAPVFLIILLRIIAIFIRLFEEERKDEIKEEAVKIMEPK